MDPNGTSPVIDKVTLVWQRVLQRSPIDANDNFFDLGGDPSSAIKIFAEISRIFGRELPPVMIYHTPTIAALAEILENPIARPFNPLLRLNAGAGQPIFIAHGLGSSVLEFFYLVKHIPLPNAIYGMQAIGGWDKDLGSIEEIAQFFLAAVKDAQPRGPYFFIGYSLGGLVVFDMAQRLLANGEKISLLVLMETYPHIHSLPPAQRVRLVVRRGLHHALVMNRLPMRQALDYLIRRSKSRFGISKKASGARHRPATGDSSTAVMQRQREIAFQAWIHYRPRYYRGKIKFVRAEINSYFPVDPAAVWGNLVQELEVEVAPGDHLGILTKHFESLAAVLYRYLKEASF